MSSDLDNPPPPFLAEDGLLLVHPDSVGQRVSLTRWFAAFALWLAVGTFLLWADPFHLHGTVLGFRVRVMIFLMLYLSLACTFIPLPTTPIVAWAATATLGIDALLRRCDRAPWMLKPLAGLARKIVATIFGANAPSIALAKDTLTRVLLIAGLGALATMIANLNDYYILTGILRARKVASVRNTRLYRAAIRWFSKSAWLTVYAFALIPIPVDVVRLLAITFRYPRRRFASACFAGRFTRYAILAAIVAMLDGQPNEQWLLVLGITVLTVGGGLGIGLPKLVRMVRGEKHSPKPALPVDEIPAAAAIGPGRRQADETSKAS